MYLQVGDLRTVALKHPMLRAYDGVNLIHNGDVLASDSTPLSSRFGPAGVHAELAQFERTCFSQFQMTSHWAPIVACTITAGQLLDSSGCLNGRGPPLHASAKSRSYRATDSVLVCPTRKPPPQALIPADAAGVLDTSRAADVDDELSDEALARPPPGCSARQRQIGCWLQQRARFSKTLLAVYYSLKLRAWLGLLV